MGNRYTMKAVEVRNETTRRKTRLTVTEARIGGPLPAVMFKPEYFHMEPSNKRPADNSAFDLVSVWREIGRMENFGPACGSAEFAGYRL